MTHNPASCSRAACPRCDDFAAGVAAGTDKLALAIEELLSKPHAQGCGCRPCGLIRLARGVTPGRWSSVRRKLLS